MRDGSLTPAQHRAASMAKLAGGLALVAALPWGLVAVMLVFAGLSHALWMATGLVLGVAALALVAGGKAVRRAVRGRSPTPFDGGLFVIGTWGALPVLFGAALLAEGDGLWGGVACVGALLPPALAWVAYTRSRSAFPATA